MAALGDLGPQENLVCQDKMAEKDQGDRWDLKVELHSVGGQKLELTNEQNDRKTVDMVSLSIQVRKELKETRESLALVREEKEDLLDQ